MRQLCREAHTVPKTRWATEERPLTNGGEGREKLVRLRTRPWALSPGVSGVKKTPSLESLTARLKKPVTKTRARYIMSSSSLLWVVNESGVEGTKENDEAKHPKGSTGRPWQVLPEQRSGTCVLGSEMEPASGRFFILSLGSSLFCWRVKRLCGEGWKLGLHPMRDCTWFWHSSRVLGLDIAA